MKQYWAECVAVAAGPALVVFMCIPYVAVIALLVALIAAAAALVALAAAIVLGPFLLARSAMGSVRARTTVDALSCAGMPVAPAAATSSVRALATVHGPGEQPGVHGRDMQPAGSRLRVVTTTDPPVIERDLP